MLSTLELRNIIETSFLPQRCQCTQGPDQRLTVKVFQPNSDRADVLVTGIDTRQLNSSRAISNLIAGLRKDLSTRRGAHAVEQKRRAHASL
jgi:hypothetical protein